MKSIPFYLYLFLTMGAFAQTQEPAFEFRKTPHQKRNLLRSQSSFRTQTLPRNGQGVYVTHPARSVHNISSVIQQHDSIYHFKWDTLNLTWNLAQRSTHMVRNANGQVEHYIVQNRVGTGWENADSVSATYDANGNQIASWYRSWNGNAWENSYRWVKTYNANNLYTLYCDLAWNGSGWDSTSSILRTYDGNGNRLTSVDKDNYSGNEFGNSGRRTWTYNNFNKVTHFLQEIWDTTHWSNNYNETTSYDASQNPVFSTSQGWVSGAWVDWYRTNAWFNAANKVTHSLIEFSFQGVWQNEQKDTTVYNQAGDPEYFFSQKWSNNAWENFSRHFYSFDNNQNQASNIAQGWNDGVWLTLSIDRTTYDVNNFILGESYKGLVNNDEWFVPLVGDSTHYYFRTVTGVQDAVPNNSGIRVFPNPSNGNLHLHAAGGIQGVELYNLLGSKVYSEAQTGNSPSIRIGVNQPKGFYLLKVRTSDKVYTERIVLE